ncbi:MAG: threonine synthase [Candidatus Aminicenantes bacterium]|nr:threonine synthase [Candidatus Aminicenantes bacterium]
MKQLECPFCKKTYALDLFQLFCSDCQEPLLVRSSVPFPKVRNEKSNPLDKYIDFLPIKKALHRFSLGEGNTPLLKLNRLMHKFNVPDLYAKNEMMNPTGSFKDRGTVIAVHNAVSLGIRNIGTVSTGNMAVSTAAYGARTGIKTYVLVSEDTSDEKIFSAALHGAILVKVKGDYGELFYKSLETGKKNHVYFINSVDPFRIEGYKVTAFEIWQQLGGQVPTHIFVPVSSGGHIIGLMKAFSELKQNKLTNRLPVFVGIQPKKASPITNAFLNGQSQITRIQKADSFAQSINNPAPPGGNCVLKWIKETNGHLLRVSDEEILKAQKKLASFEGLFGLPAAAAPLAGLFKWQAQNKLAPHHRIVLILTGAGFKNMAVLDRSQMPIYQTVLDDLDQMISQIGKNKEN